MSIKIVGNLFSATGAGRGSGRQANGTDGRKSERKYKENPKKMTMFQDEKQGAITPPKNQSPEFNVKVAHKM
jgi:hypothetical protein